MIDREHAVLTVLITSNPEFAICNAEKLPDCHPINQGTMGEYERSILILKKVTSPEHNGRKDTPYPAKPGSMYHLSKVHDSHNIHLLHGFGAYGQQTKPCGLWGADGRKTGMTSC